MFSVRYPILSFLIVLFTLAGSAGRARASHAMGADLTYTCVGPNTYEFRLNFYRDCVGISAPSTASVDVSSASCGLSFSITLLPDTLFTGLDTFYFGDEVSPLCPANLPLSTCNGGPFPGVQVYSYSQIVTLPAICPDWEISYSLCCRNVAIDNLFDPDSEDIYVEALLDNTGGLCNNSVVFTQIPVTYICNGEPFNFNHGAIDADGDSLFYSLINPLGGDDAPIPYAPGFSLTEPMMALGGVFGFDPVTGQITFTPDGEQTGVLTVLVEEFRDGVLVGSTMRDIQIVVTNCPSNSAPVYIGSFIGLEGGVAVDGNSIESCPGDTIRFRLRFTDANPGDVLTLASTLPLIIPDADVTILGSNPVNMDVVWITDPSDTGFYAFNVSVSDDACPIFANQIFSFDIDLLAGTYAGPDQRYCPGGVPPTLTVSGGTAFSWTPPLGLDNPFSPVPKASPSVTTDYVVESNLSSFCRNRDTVRVTVVPPFFFLLSSGDTICRYDVTTIGVVTDTIWGPYTYSWSPLEGLSDPASPVTDASPYATTFYQIEMVSDTGCTMLDSIPVVIQGAVPQLNAVTDRFVICPGVPAQLDLVPSCGAESLPCATSDVAIVGEGFESTDGPTPFKGGYDDSRIQILYDVESLRKSGFYGGVINELAFFISEKNSTTTYQEFRIRMRCFEGSDLSEGFTGDAETVFGPFDLNTVSGWNNFVLDQPYAWGGDLPLLVEICFDNPDYDHSDNDEVYYTEAGYISTVFDFNLLSSGCGMDESPSFSSQRPNIRLRFCNADASAISINWSPPAGLSAVDIQNPLSLPASGPLTYIVQMDDNGCISADTLTVDLDNSLVLDAGTDQQLCTGESVVLNAVAMGTPPPDGFAWNWIPAGGLSDPFVLNPTANPSVSTWYVLETTSLNGCVVRDSALVTVNAFSASVDPGGSICAGNSWPLAASGGTLYSWFPVEGLSCTDCPEPFASPEFSTLYQAVIVDANGCSDTLSTYVQVNPLPYMEAFADTTIFLGETAWLSATPGVSYQWTPETGLSDPSAPVTSANPEETTIYTLLLTDANGCFDTREVTVTVLELLEIYVPNAFSPNGDGQNDQLFVINRGLAGIQEFSIYNRWGELLFSTANILEGWDGTYKGVAQEVGTYTAVIRAESLTGNILQKNLAVQLVR